MSSLDGKGFEKLFSIIEFEFSARLGMNFPIQKWEDFFTSFSKVHVVTPVISARHHGVAVVADNVEEGTVMVASMRAETQRCHIPNPQISRRW